MLLMKPFDQYDWDAFSGAEGEAHIWAPPNALIIIIHDARGITMLCGGDRGEHREFCFPGTLEDAEFLAQSMVLGAPLRAR